VLKHEQIREYARQASVAIFEWMYFQELNDKIADDENRMKLFFDQIFLRPLDKFRNWVLFWVGNVFTLFTLVFIAVAWHYRSKLKSGGVKKTASFDSFKTE